MSGMTTVIPNGAKVLLADDVEGVVIGIQIRGKENVVIYEVAWWAGRDRHTAWFESYEVKMLVTRDQHGYDDACPQSIGFLP